VSGGGSVTSISPSLTATTTYFAQARNSTTNCVSASRTEVTATVNAIPNAPTMTGSSPYCTSGTITATYGSGGNGIKWDNGSSTSLRTVTETGTYRAITTSSGGCTSSTATISVTITLPGAEGNAPTACSCESGLVNCNGTCNRYCALTEWPDNPCGFTHISPVIQHDPNSWGIADATCRSVGGRLPTRAEYNCMYHNSTTVPYGFGQWSDAWWLPDASPSGHYYWVKGFDAIYDFRDYWSVAWKCVM
jgi:hypothetical protein